MSTRFFTNHGEQTLFEKFKGVFESNPDIERFDALVGYLRSSGYFALRPYLEKVPHIRILVGINVDAIMADYHRRGLLFLADPTKALEEFRAWLRNDIQGAAYRRDIETGIIQFIDDVISKKIELRAHPTKRLHAMRLSYQVDAVTSGFRLLEKHGGFFLADVVGLGKTMIATLIAKKFFFYNGFPEHRSHTLIVVPPAVEDNWRETTKEQFRLDNCDIITNGSLHKVRNPEKYDLIIVDEAHKFRNDTADAFDELQRICKSPTRRLLPDGSCAAKRVILVSATPLNNRPDDIRNLLSLFQDLKDSTLGVSNLQHFFAQRQKEYQEAHRQRDPEEARRRVKHTYELIRTKIISEVTVRRTRNDLMEHDDYKKDLENQKVIFPKIAAPRKILYQLPPPLEALYDRTMLLLSRTDGKGLTYNRYRAISFLKAEKKIKYQNADRISTQLATIMRTLLVKRLDSNFKEQVNDYDILISTEVLAEGVNLHRANIILNYDTPWNSTRLMQRIGRLNRIGSVAPVIYIYNFYPTAKVEDDIELKKKAIVKLQAFHTALGEDSQIYSETEEVDNFGLFERSPEEEERDERLSLLMELRQFRQQNPEEFRRIKGLPLRARVGRVDKARAGGTVTFIRSQRRDGFYRIKPDGALEEISLLEVADEFRATDPKEKAVPLHVAHHDHINSALIMFKEAVVAETLQAATVDATQGPNEQRALRYLDGFAALPFVSETERSLIQAAKIAIRRARFQNLQRQINQLQRSTKTVKLTQAALADKLMQILRSYPLQQADDTPVTSAPRAVDTTPDIILSESFDQRS